MKMWALGLITLLVLIITWLAVAVMNDVNDESIGICNDLRGSLCNPDTNCPEGFSLAPKYSCSPKDWYCCVPQENR